MNHVSALAASALLVLVTGLGSACNRNNHTDDGPPGADTAQASPDAVFLEAMEQLSAHAFAAYRGLVYETEGFEDYIESLEQFTPEWAEEVSGVP